MRINSVSQLSSSSLQTFADIIGHECYIEMSQLSGTTDIGLKLYDSVKLDFQDYSTQISTLKDEIKDYIDTKVAQLCAYIDQLSAEISRRLDAQDDKIETFIQEAHSKWFVHKNPEWTEPEDIYGTKNFVDIVHIMGPNSKLSADTIIEGTARKALWS